MSMTSLRLTGMAEEIYQLRAELKEHRELGMAYHRQALELAKENKRLKAQLRKALKEW